MKDRGRRGGSVDPDRRHPRPGRTGPERPRGLPMVAYPNLAGLLSPFQTTCPRIGGSTTPVSTRPCPGPCLSGCCRCRPDRCWSRGYCARTSPSRRLAPAWPRWSYPINGARNLDTVPATVSALPRVAEAAGGQVPVLIDGASGKARTSPRRSCSAPSWCWWDVPTSGR